MLPKNIKYTDLYQLQAGDNLIIETKTINDKTSRKLTDCRVLSVGKQSFTIGLGGQKVRISFSDWRPADLITTTAGTKVEAQVWLNRSIRKQNLRNKIIDRVINILNQIKIYNVNVSIKSLLEFEKTITKTNLRNFNRDKE